MGMKSLLLFLIHKELSLNYKRKNDPRITRLGIFLRRTSLQHLVGCADIVRHRSCGAQNAGSIFMSERHRS
jgi:hypothetical protein